MTDNVFYIFFEDRRPPMSHDIDIYEGADWRETWYLQDGAEDPYNLTGYQAELTIRIKAEGPIVYKMTSSPAAGITITASTGKVALDLTNANTTSLAIRCGVYDMVLVASSIKTRLLNGNINIHPAITR